jgi:alpha/beta superfamily hydrolase
MQTPDHPDSFESYFIEAEHTFLLPGPAGALEVRTARAQHNPAQQKQTRTVAVICHPHPLHGGTLHNKVVYILHKAYTDVGIHTVRFNYRGVGQSQGTFGQSAGELSDLFSIIDWLNTQCNIHRLYLAGFSFGAYIALAASQQVSTQHVITIAPALHHQDFNALLPIKTPWLLIQGDQDEVITATDVYQWVKTLSPPPQVIHCADAGHFFHGQLTPLRNTIATHLTQHLLASGQ